MKSISLIFGTTNSLPVGTPPQEFERVYQRIYKPFLRVLYNMPNVPLTLHYSGTLLTWLDSNHSEFTDVLGEMVQRKQVEMLGGGFWDPVFSLIPRQDSLGQIEGLTTFLRKRFGRRPRGAWITEHVWEPFLASTLKNSGIEHIFLDDHHFKVAGLHSGELTRPCLTEDQGKVVVVFPVRRSLEEHIGVTPPEQVLASIRELATEDGSGVISMMYDGRRYTNGSTNSHPDYDDHWLERFLTLAQKESDWLTLTTPSQYLRGGTPRRRAYFPATSHDDMMLWTLNPGRQRTLLHVKSVLNGSDEDDGYLAGGFFRDFLTRYPESNMLYAKMQYTHVLVNQIRGDKYRKQAAREELWKGQSHTAYWHGAAGGIYHNHLRKALYRALIEAEKVTREKGIFIPSIVSVDYDMDGLDEYLYQGQEMNAYVHREGARLVELDYLAVPWNYMDVMSRHMERYHEELGDDTAFDRYTRRSFIDHFFTPYTTIDQFDAMQHEDAARLYTRVFTVTEYHRTGNDLTLECEFDLKTADGNCKMKLQKCFTFENSTVSGEVTLTNMDAVPAAGVYGCEVNLGFVSDQVDALRVHVFPESDPAIARKTLLRRNRSDSDSDSGIPHTEVGPSRQVLPDAGTIIYEDLVNRLDIAVSFRQQAETWSLPVCTHSMHENHLDTIYQGSSLVPRWTFAIPPGESVQYSVSLRISRS